MSPLEKGFEYGVKNDKIVDKSIEAIGVKKPMFNKKKEGQVYATSCERQERKL